MNIKQKRDHSSYLVVRNWDMEMGSIHATGTVNVQHDAVEKTNVLPKTLVRLIERFPGTSMSNV